MNLIWYEGERIHVHSLNRPRSGDYTDEKTEWITFVEDDSPAPDEEIQESQPVARVAEALDRLPQRGRQVVERDREALVLYFGLTGPAHTLKQVGQVMGVARERARQLIAQTLLNLWKAGTPSKMMKSKLHRIEEAYNKKTA